MATHVIHVEVVGRDGPKLQKFYADAFGWGLDTNNPDGYGMFRDENGFTAGIGKSPMGGDGHVTFYVHTDDPAGTLKKTGRSGTSSRQSAPCGVFKSSTMIVIRMATTPSLNEAILALSIRTPDAVGRQAR